MTLFFALALAATPSQILATLQPPPARGKDVGVRCQNGRDVRADALLEQVRQEEKQVQDRARALAKPGAGMPSPDDMEFMQGIGAAASAHGVLRPVQKMQKAREQLGEKVTKLRDEMNDTVENKCPSSKSAESHYASPACMKGAADAFRKGVEAAVEGMLATVGAAWKEGVAAARDDLARHDKGRANLGPSPSDYKKMFAGQLDLADWETVKTLLEEASPTCEAAKTAWDEAEQSHP